MNHFCGMTGKVEFTYVYREEVNTREGKCYSLWDSDVHLNHYPLNLLQE